MENIFQRPPILMRLTMLTRDKMSLLRAASLRTAWETAHGLNDRKQRGWVEAGIPPPRISYSKGETQIVRATCCLASRQTSTLPHPCLLYDSELVPNCINRRIFSSGPSDGQRPWSIRTALPFGCR